MSINKIIKIGGKIKAYRKNLKLTQAEMANKLGIPRSTYANYENDSREPNIDILNKISSVIGIPLNDIFNAPPSSDFELTNEQKRSNLMYKIMNLFTSYTPSEIKNMVDYVDGLKKQGSFVISKTTSRDDEIEILIDKLSGCEKSTELSYILAIKTAYNVSDNNYLKYFPENTTDEIINIIASVLEDNCADYTYDELIKIMNLIIDTIGFSGTIDIIDNADFFITEWNRIDTAVDNVKKLLYESFTKIQ